MSKVVCLYHDKCLDGFAAASVIMDCFGSENVDLVPGNYGDDSIVINISKIDDVKNKDLYIVDFSLNPGQLHELEDIVKSITLIDHHVSAQKMLKGFIPKKKTTKIIFDMSHSGAVLTFIHLHKGLIDSVNETNKYDVIPTNLKLVEDRDLWKWEHGDTEAFTTYMYNKCDSPIDYHSELSTKPMCDIVAEGKVVVDLHWKRVSRALTEAQLIGFEGHLVPILNCPRDLASDVGHRLCIEHNVPFSITYRDVGDKRIFSLRGTGKVDVSEIASRRGGGGHHDAAGFNVPHDVYKYLKDG